MESETMTAPSDAENQILLFNTILRLEQKLDRREERIDRRFDLIERRFDQMESRVARIEDAIYDIRDYLQRSAPRGLGFNPAQPPSDPQQQESEQI